jgi:heptosyltransferase I
LALTAMNAGAENRSRDGRVLPRRILVVRLGAMGDVIHALPAVHLLRAAIPHCDIGWAIEQRWLPLLCARGSATSGETSAARPLVNRIHTVDTHRWRKSPLASSTYSELSEAISSIRARRYDVAIDFQGAIKSALLASVSGAKVRVGFAEPRERAARLFYSQTVNTPMAHVVDKNFALAREIAGDATVPPRTLLPVDEAAEAWATQQLSELQVGKFALLAPTAGWRAKEWPAKRFGEVAIALAKSGVQSLINLGPGEEAVAAEIGEASKGSAIPLNCDLSQLIAVTRRASLFIGGDTGPMHLASALNVPVVALFGPTDPSRNGPYSPRATVLRSAASVTSYSHVANRDEGLASITTDEVVAAAVDVMS